MVKRYALLSGVFIQNIAIWDEVSPWVPTLDKADVSLNLKARMGGPVNNRNGNAYTHNIVADGNSLVVGDYGGPVRTVHNGILDAGLTQYDYIIMARNGWATPDLTSKAANDIDLLYEASLGSKNILVFWEGTNDLNNGKTAAQAYANIKAYCQARKAAGWVVIVCTILPRTNSLNANHEASRLEVNESIRTNAVSEGWADQVVDIGADPLIGLTGSASNIFYYSDGLHLTSEGHSVSKTYLSSALMELI